MFKKILVIPAGDSADQAAVKRMSQLVGRSTETELFEPVHEPHLDGYLGNTEIYAPLRRSLLEQETASLEELSKAVAAGGHRCLAVTRWDYPRDQAVAREALAFGADLVIVTPSRARHGILSSSEWKLVAHCPAPILVVKSQGDGPYERIVACVDPVHAHAKPEDLDDEIVACAAKVRDVTGGGLELVHCFLPLAYFGTEDMDRVPLQDAEVALEKSRQKAVSALAARAGLTDEATRLIAGKPAAVLEDMAEKGETDLIVMGGLSRGMLADLLIGSTAERVLGHATADVLIVKPPSLEIEVPPAPRIPGQA